MYVNTQYNAKFRNSYRELYWKV